MIDISQLCHLYIQCKIDGCTYQQKRNTAERKPGTSSFVWDPLLKVQCSSAEAIQHEGDAIEGSKDGGIANKVEGFKEE